MALIQKAIKVGTSVAAVLPKAILGEVGIRAGTAITVEATHEGVLVRPVKKTKGRGTSDDERVAESALSLMNRYKAALDRLKDA